MRWSGFAQPENASGVKPLYAIPAILVSLVIGDLLVVVLSLNVSLTPENFGELTRPRRRLSLSSNPRRSAARIRAV